MKKPIEAINAAQSANADTALALMRNTLDAIERLAALNLNTMRDALESTTIPNTKLTGVKDLAEAGKAIAQPSMDRTRAYYHQVYDLMSEMQDQLTKVMQAHYNALSESATSATQALSAGTPVGGEAFAAAMKAMLDTNTKAFERINDTAHQIQAGVREMGATISKQAASASSATAKAASSSRKKAS